jgi:threo-3-hydroxy-L-aspartate ammonia-lyase
VSLAIDAEDVRAAAGRLRGVAHRTPVVTSRTVDEQTGARVFFKCESLQRAGAFKFRGACNAIAQLDPARQSGGVVTFSSGNHAQAVALAARLAGVPALIAMPEDAPRAKLEATRGYGAEVVLYDRYAHDREALARRLAVERGMTLIPPYDHPHVMAGQGTAALELFEDVGALDLLVVPVGGGGLISGCAVLAAAEAPACRVVGVEPAAGDDVRQSLAAGAIVHIDVPRTIADGAQTQHAGRFTFPVIQAHVAEIVTVTDAQLVAAMRLFLERLKLVVEPTGVLGAAAVLDGVIPVRGQRVGVIVSGGNVDAARLAALLVG